MSYRSDKLVPNIPPVTMLRKLLNNEDHQAVGELYDVRKACETLMKDIEDTAKEVGGDPSKSQRYIYTKEILYHIRQLGLLIGGNYTFVTASEDLKDPS